MENKQQGFGFVRATYDRFLSRIDFSSKLYVYFATIFLQIVIWPIIENVSLLGCVR